MKNLLLLVSFAATLATAQDEQEKTAQDDNQRQETAEYSVQEILNMTLSVLALVVGSLVATYTVIKIVDLCTNYCHRNQTPYSHAEKDNMLGLSESEREQVLKHIFRDNIKEWEGPVAQDQSETDETMDPESQHAHTCSICLTPHSNLVLETPCHHVFHQSCAFPWLGKHKDCPYCRQTLVSDADFAAAIAHVLGEERIQELQIPGGELELVEVGEVQQDST